MLPAAHRLTSGAGFRTATREGLRRGSRTLVVHQVVGGGDRAVVGFVVSRAVGGAVVRNRVRRRLRHLCRERLPGLPSPSTTVVRALPSSATATYDELAADLDSCLARCGSARGRDRTVAVGDR